MSRGIRRQSEMPAGPLGLSTRQAPSGHEISDKASLSMVYCHAKRIRSDPHERIQLRLYCVSLIGSLARSSSHSGVTGADFVIGADFRAVSFRWAKRQRVPGESRRAYKGVFDFDLAATEISEALVGQHHGCQISEIENDCHCFKTSSGRALAALRNCNTLIAILRWLARQPFG